MSINNSVSDLSIKVALMEQEIKKLKELEAAIESLNYWLSITSETDSIRLINEMPGTPDETIIFAPKSKAIKEMLLTTMANILDTLEEQYRSRATRLLLGSITNNEE